jgi:hypothetical protein
MAGAHAARQTPRDDEENPMAAVDAYRKTDLGMAEIRSRKMKLNPRLRTMLILIDGEQPEFILKEEGVKVGAPPDFIAQLLAAGLIEKAGRASVPAANAPSAPAAAPEDAFTQFRHAKDFMNVTVVDALGIRSFMFTLKLERAGTVDDLRGLAEGYREAIAKGAGDEQAAVLAARLEDMLR